MLPAVVFFLAFLNNFLSLYYVASGGNYRKKLFGNPAFVIGDFFLIPLYFALSSIFFVENIDPLMQINPILFVLTGIIAALVTVFFGLKFHLLKPVWIPHGVFHWAVIYTLLVVLLTIWLYQLPLFPIPGIIIILLAFHQILAMVFPKKLSPNR